ncbi:MAG TPA: hypothetical protein VL326_11875 [Kofleriaceae bacterium]|jgi:hypothetical protein|nr:hypothetical protein [Kofleriaceae bacterium]
MWFALLLALAVVTTGCNRHKDEVIEPGGPPPLPPASGTAVGYLVDAAADLQLSSEQLEKMKHIDDSLAAQNGSIEVQIRQIEQPVPAEELSPQQMKAGEKAQRYDNAPGKSTVQTADSQRLHKIHDDNEREALKRALALLDAKQLERAKRILEDRGVAIPGEAKQEAPAGSDDGQPLPGMEP